jgi:hypothetical protein
MGVRSIKELCDEKGITIEELSQKVGFDVVEFEYRSKNETREPLKEGSYIEKVTYQGVVLSEALKICEVFGIQIPDLFEKRIPGSEPKMFTIQDAE